MSRLHAVDPSTAHGKAKNLLDAVKGKLGVVPNMTRVMAISPVVLESYLGFSGALAGGLLDARTREQIALLTAQENHCNYCLSAHTAIGKMVGLDHGQIVASREGDGSNPKTTATLTFAKRVLETKGQVSEADLAAVGDAGLSEGEIAEIIAHVALNVFTNYFNVATDVEIDFPKVSYAEVA
ncbi:carboxymuconolactone decarboxylase family protein [Terriglobus saanensis]|uniref:Alkylhydroperoxidase like protein, AhpD family n=1 Tax=Terriglobus saanensis (strain ATCC BAA-1853 / DSM 23119 / SP1PR4) TaxID=401053 RepID=E8UZ41_TERSS|nr:carboxymuconolactone decarboxylase family protein [Terriglobus saanensis]ADV80986.1 alkylhydroperoxidase like protein, AhpD family [Terriglobus saanensis SP1PR4]